MGGLLVPRCGPDQVHGQGRRGLRRHRVKVLACLPPANFLLAAAVGTGPRRPMPACSAGILVQEHQSFGARRDLSCMDPEAVAKNYCRPGAVYYTHVIRSNSFAKMSTVQHFSRTWN